MEISALSAFLAVAENDSFSKAGEQLHLTQPAVSKRVAALENELGMPLFDRLGKQVSLTEAGRKLLPRAHRMILEIDDIRRTLANLSGGVEGTLTMGTSHHIGLRRLPQVLKSYSRTYPEVRLDIRFMDSEDACAAVEHGDLELAIATLPITPREQLLTKRIWQDPLHFVAARDHPLAKRAAPLTLEDLSRYPAVLAATGTYTREILEQALRPKQLSLEVGMATNYLETLRMMVNIGLGWSLLPETMIDNGDLRILQIPEFSLARQLGAVTHQNRTLSNSARAMIEACLSHASDQ